MSGPAAKLKQLGGKFYRRSDSPKARLAAIDARLNEIDGRLNHWIETLGSINHGVSDIQSKLADASADVEMAAAMLMAADRRDGRTGGNGRTEPSGS